MTVPTVPRPCPDRAQGTVCSDRAHRAPPLLGGTGTGTVAWARSNAVNRAQPTPRRSHHWLPPSRGKPRPMTPTTQEWTA
jgi:hypothetical protein